MRRKYVTLIALGGTCILASLALGFALAITMPETSTRIRALGRATSNGWNRALVEDAARREGLSVEAFLHQRLDRVEAENALLYEELANACAIIEEAGRRLDEAQAQSESLKALATDLIEQITAEPLVVPLPAPDGTDTSADVVQAATSTNKS